MDARVRVCAGCDQRWSSLPRQKGIKVEDIRVGNSKAPLTNFVDPNGVRIELLEYPAESWQKQAMDSWR